MKFYFHPDAVTELNEAVAYYEDCLLGLGIQFAEEVSAYRTHNRISSGLVSPFREYAPMLNKSFSIRHSLSI